MPHFVSQEQDVLGPVSISDKTSYHKISWCLEATRFAVWIITSHWKFKRQPSSTTAEVPIKCHSDRTILNTNLVVSGLCEILQKVVLSDTETGPRCQSMLSNRAVNTLKLRKNGHGFAHNIFRFIFLHGNLSNLMQILLKFLPRGERKNIQVLTQIMIWCQRGDKRSWWPSCLINVYVSLDFDELTMESGLHWTLVNTLFSKSPLPYITSMG